jgi:hypothetical protein
MRIKNPSDIEKISISGGFSIPMNNREPASIHKKLLLAGSYDLIKYDPFHFI